MPTDEQACLVAPRSDSDNSGFGACAMAYTEGSPGAPQDPVDTSLNNMAGPDSGELLDYSDRSALSQFHEEAIKQAGCGMYQLRLVLCAGLALCGATVEQAAVPFILPSAEIELCIILNEKSWLGMISLLGLCLGSAGWGKLADSAGRRRTLVSCLAVNAVFSTVAAFMPTYGTFMLARFCSAIGSGAILPTVYTYVGEHCSRAHRRRVLAALPLFVGVGGFYAAGLAGAVVPRTGLQAVIENKEHFSAWHRYLLLCTLPILASLLSLVWVDESPRYLLESGREVEALHIYQNIHRSNKSGLCAGDADLPSCDYRLGQLPAAKRSVNNVPKRAMLRVQEFFQEFFQLFSRQNLHVTATLGGTLLFTMCVHYAMIAYVPSTLLQMEAAEFESRRVTISNKTFENEFYNSTIENVDYINSTFTNCTFRDIFLSHVEFKNCSFYYVTFSNVKTSYTSFKGTLFVNSSLLQTDVEADRDMDAWCELRATTLRGLRPGCRLRADLASDLRAVTTQLHYVAAAHALAAPLAALPLSLRASVLLFGVCLLTPAIYFVMSETALYILLALFQLLLTLAQFTLILHIVESYPTHLRCTAHGVMLSAVYAGAMIVTCVYSNLYPNGYIPATLVTAVLAVMATVFSLKIRQSENNLL